MLKSIANPKNNFDFLRLVFALLVIISHSYPLSGSTSNDLLYRITDGQEICSGIGLKGFFTLSGYLVFQSYERSNNIFDFSIKRVLRIYPGLIVVLTLTVLLAPLVYEGTVPYFENSSVWRYIPMGITLHKIQPGIDGVFENNPFRKVINGSLWTIQYECVLYILLSFFFLIKNRINATRASIIILYILMLAQVYVVGDRLPFKGACFFINNFTGFGLFFLGGALLASFKYDRLKNNNLILVLSILLIILSFILNLYTYTKWILFPVAVISFGLKSTAIISSLKDAIGDLSYGVYIYAFPVQQTLVHFYKLNYIQLMILASLISLVLAYGSWHLVERRALRLKVLLRKASTLRK